MTIKLGLLGTNISHSLSPLIYERLLKCKFTYDLIDTKNLSAMPTLEMLSKKFDGLNITTPLKNFFLECENIELTSEAKITGAINCLRFTDKIIGHNTDYLALLQLLKEYANFYVYLIGDGTMASCTKIVLNQMAITYTQYSRKLTNDFDHLKFDKHDSSMPVLIINSCSRDYIFKGQLDQTFIFLDYNYNFIPHHSSIAPYVLEYIDGMEFLNLQAKYCTKFWMF